MPSSKWEKLTINLPTLNALLNRLGTPAINLAARREGSAQNLQNGTLEVLGHRLVAHGASNVDDFVERDGLGVLDVLLLLAVARGLFEGLDDERGSGWDDGDGGLTVLDGQADRDAEAFL